MPELKSIQEFIGAKYGRITVLEDLGLTGRIRFIRGKCDCGKEKIFNWSNVKTGKSTSCGCISIEKNTKHGLSSHSIYSVWEGIIDRCYNKNYNKYHRYGGRGVTVCDEWRHDFKTFYDWAITNGWEKGLSLDKDKLAPTYLGKIYSPEFCCFLTRKENSMYRNNSRLLEYNGKTLCVAQWAEEYGIKYPTFQARLQKGWSIEKILSIPIRNFKRKVA